MQQVNNFQVIRLNYHIRDMDCKLADTTRFLLFVDKKKNKKNIGSSCVDTFLHGSIVDLFTKGLVKALLFLFTCKQGMIEIP